MPKYILLADDSVTIQKVVELTFSDGDYNVTCVSNGKLALQKIQEQRPDILLCDVIMPELNGYEVCTAVKHTPELAGIPVVLMTGTFEPFDEEKARQAGADTFVTKPFESKLLVEKVEELLKKRMILDTTLPMESAQVFHSRQEFTIQAPAPTDEELLASERGTSEPAAAFESPFLPVPEVPPTPVKAAAPPPPAAFLPPPPQPPASEAFEEVFASPPSIAPEEYVPTQPWEPPAPVTSSFEPVPEVPSPAESLFMEAPPHPAAPEQAPPFASPPEPELPPFESLAPEEPLEVVHDMMDQEEMVSRAHGQAPDASPDVPPFEGLDEVPPLEMPYESLAPAPPAEVASVDFPGAPEPLEAEAPLTTMAFDSPEVPAPTPLSETEAPRGEEGGEALFDAEPAEAYTPVEAPYLDAETESPAMEISPPAPDAVEATPPALEGAFAETPQPFTPAEAFAAPAPHFFEPPAPAWEPPVSQEPQALSPEEAFAPAAPAEPFVEPPAAEEAPVWEPPTALEPQPSIPEVQTWEPPVDQPAPAFQEVEEAPVTATESAPVGSSPAAPPDVIAPFVPEAFAPVPEKAEEESAFPPEPETAEEEPAFPPEPETAEEEPAFPPEPGMAEEEPAFPPEPEMAEEGPAFPPEAEVAEEEAPQFIALAPQVPVSPEVESAVLPISHDLPEAPPQAAPSVSAEEIEAAVRKVVAELAPEIIRQVAWEVIPELAESLIKRRIRELESAEE